jgi:hypothetical protein
MGLPGLRQAPVVKPPGDAKEAKLVLDLKRKDGNDFSPGTWTCYAAVRGTIQWKPDEKGPQKEVPDAAWSAPITVKIEPSPVMLTLPERVTVAPGGKVEVMVKVERRYGFAEALTMEVVGENGLTAEKVTIPKEAGEAKLVIAAGKDAKNVPEGNYVAVVNAKCSWNGVEVPWSVNCNVEVKP